MKNVLKWSELLMKDFLKNDLNYRQEFIQWIFRSYNDFEIKFKASFGDLNKKRMAERKLVKLR